MAKVTKTRAKPKKPAKVVAPVKILKQEPFWIGFDLGGTKMLCNVLTAGFRVLATTKRSTGGSDGAIKGLKRITDLIEEAIRKAEVDPKCLKGIGMGCPGLVDPSRGILISAPNLGWTNVPLRKLLSTHFKCAVSVLNDVDAGTYGEYTMGGGKGARSLLGVFPGTGVGTGFVYDGQLIQGKSISCMELGMVLMPGTHLGSSEFGTVSVEDLTSRLALASQAAVACYRGQMPELDKKSGGSLREIRSKALATSFHDGDDATLAMFRNSIRYLGMGVAMVVNLLAPDRVVLGGGLVEEMPELYLAAIREEVARFALPGLSKDIRYAVAKLGGNAVSVGAVAYHQKFGEKAL